MRAKALLACLLIGPALFACSALEPDVSTQEADHTEGEPTFAQYRWLWADETEEEFKQIRNASSDGWSVPTFLPTDHPMTQRLQFWIDAMDRVLREANPAALAGTPVPRVIIEENDTPNAWVSYIPVAWDVKTRLARAGKEERQEDVPVGDAGAVDAGEVDASAPAPTKARAREIAIGRNAEAGPAFTAPLERAHSATDLTELIKFYNEGFAKCRLSLEADELVIGSECAAAQTLSADRSDRVAFNATGKWVTVTTGLLKSMLDEDRIVAVIAHELGHYYRTHSAQPTDVLNYFYALGDANQAYKPAPDARYLEQTLAVRAKLRTSTWGTNYEEENRLMTEQRLGFYTTEQEADEIALEVLAKVGLPPTLGPESMLQLQRSTEAEVEAWGGRDTGELGWTECTMARERGFKDEAGQPISVPVGELSDPHHSFCFRVFNMTREIAAHHYKVASSQPRPRGDWSELLTDLSAPTPAPAPTPSTPPTPEPPPELDAGSDSPADGG